MRIKRAHSVPGRWGNLTTDWNIITLMFLKAFGACSSSFPLKSCGSSLHLKEMVKSFPTIEKVPSDGAVMLFE